MDCRKRDVRREEARTRGNADAGITKGGAGGAQSHGGLGFEALFAH